MSYGYDVKPLAPARYIDGPEALNDWIVHLEQAPVIGVDTESDSFFHYREKVCLIQMTALGQDALIDPLSVDVTPLSAVFADGARIKIFHDAIYDLVCLQRDFGFQFAGLFDTMLASRMLGCKSFGLAAVLAERFGFTADKRWQRSNWAKRPLCDEQKHYAQSDTHFLPKLRELLTAQLHEQGRLAWADEDFRRLPEFAANIPGRPEQPDPDGFWRIRGVKSMTAEVRGRVKALYMVREVVAQRMDRPPFKVFGDQVLVDIAIDGPKTIGELGPRAGFGRGAVERFGAQILSGLRHARPVHGKAPAGSGRRRRSGRSLDVQARKRYEVLRNLRKDLAADLGLEPEVLLGNAILEDLARQPPNGQAELLASQAELAGWRRQYLLQPLLDVLENESEALLAAPELNPDALQ